MKFQEIKINPVDNGVRVKVGCMELVYQQKDFKQFFRDLEDYFKDPTKTEKAIRKRWGIEDDRNISTVNNPTTLAWQYNYGVQDDKTKT